MSFTMADKQNDAASNVATVTLKNLIDLIVERGGVEQVSICKRECQHAGCDAEHWSIELIIKSE